MIPSKEELQKHYDEFYVAPVAAKPKKHIDDNEYHHILKYYLLLLSDNLIEAAKKGRTYSTTLCTYRDFQRYPKLEKDIRETFKDFDVVFYKETNITIRIFWCD